MFCAAGLGRCRYSGAGAGSKGENYRGGRGVLRRPRHDLGGYGEREAKLTKKTADSSANGGPRNDNAGEGRQEGDGEDVRSTGRGSAPVEEVILHSHM